MAHVDVDGVVVGVVDQDIVGPGGDGPLTGGFDLQGHLTGGGRVEALPQLGLGPEGGEGRTFEDAQREEKRAAKKPRAKKEETVKIDNQPASTTLGDIDVLAQLKAQMEKGE